MNKVAPLLLYVSESIPFRSRLDHRLIRAAMVFTFFAFSIQKWNPYTAKMLAPLISHSPVVFWLMKDILFLVVSFYLLKQDPTRAGLKMARS